MTNNKKILQGLCGVIAACLFAACSEAAVCAGVSATREATGDAGDVYVAGNPDAYPIEYYDRESGEYRGLIPDLLNIVSEETGIGFVYISAGRDDQQEQLSQNDQVEMVTAVSSEDGTAAVVETCPVLTVLTDKGEVAYGVGFTKIASPEMIRMVADALGKIPSEQKDALLLQYAQSNHPRDRLEHLITAGAIIAGSVLFTLMIVLMIRFRQKKKQKTEERIDPVTGVGNADYYEYFFEAFIEGPGRTLYNIVYISFDTEKVEKEWGSAAVTDIQKYAAAYLNTKLGSVECIARVRDGAFALALQTDSGEELNARMDEMLDGLSSYLYKFNEDWRNVFSAGVCRLADHPDCNAETAVYNAKQGYIHSQGSEKNYSVGSVEWLSAARKTQKLRSSLKDAFANSEFRIYIQFIYSERDADYCGGEVLSRWQSREYGLLKPYEYLDILMETGRIVEYDYHIFGLVCKQIEAWDHPPFSKLTLSCNFTRNSVSQKDFADRVMAIAGEYDFDRSRILIEITEDSLSSDPVQVSENIRKCRENGFQVALDDIGTGFSSLSDLYDNDIDVVKIEQAFTSSCTSPRRKKMLRDFISMIHNTGARVVCEGIETGEQVAAMREIECDMIQGFYYSRALPLSECENFIIGKQKAMASEE